LSQIAWAFAEVKVGGDPLFVAISLRAAVLLEDPEEESMEVGMHALSLAYAFTVLSDHPPGAIDVPRAAAKCLEKYGKKLDQKYQSNFIPTLGQRSMTEPAILHYQQGLCLVWKPPGWEVTVTDGEEEQVVYGTGPQLQDWLARFECPIAHDAVACHGILHRLDRFTSGMVMWASTYESYYRLRLAFATNRVQKEYLCLCEGWMPCEPRLLTASIQRIWPKEPGGAHRSEVSVRGRRASTEILEVAHALGPGGEPVSLVKVRIYTGRMHQIRVHMSNEGFPLVGDGTYGGSSPEWSSTEQPASTWYLLIKPLNPSQVTEVQENWKEAERKPYC